MSSVTGLLLNILILAALGVAIFYCVRLSKQLNQVRAERKAFETLIQSLNFASARAEGSIQSFKEVATGNGDILQDKINKARAMVDELEIMIQAGDSLADRLQNLAEKSRRVSGAIAPESNLGRGAPVDSSQQETRQPEVQSKPLAAEPRTRAEKELLDAIKAKQQS
jgi:hypothetical protein